MSSKALSYSKWDGIGDDSDEETLHDSDNLIHFFQNACELKAQAEAEYTRGEGIEGGNVECYRRATSMYEDCMREILTGCDGVITNDNCYDNEDKNETIVALKAIYRTCELNTIACSLKQSKWHHVITTCKRLLDKRNPSISSDVLRRVLYFISSAYIRLSGGDNDLREVVLYSKKLYTHLKEMEKNGGYIDDNEMTQYNKLFDDVMERNEKASLSSNTDEKVKKAKITEYLKAGMVCYKQKDYSSAINYFKVVSQNSILMDEIKNSVTADDATSVYHRDYLDTDALLSLDHSDVYERIRKKIDVCIDRPHSYVCMAEAGLAISLFVTNYQKHKDSLEGRLRDAAEKLLELLEEICDVSKKAIAHSCRNATYAKSTLIITQTISTITTTTVDPSTSKEVINATTVPAIVDEVTQDDSKSREDKLQVERGVIEMADEKILLFLTFALNTFECLAELLEERKNDAAAADMVAQRALSLCDKYIEHFDYELNIQKDIKKKGITTPTLPALATTPKAIDLPAHSKESSDILRRKAIFLLRRGTYLNEGKYVNDNSPEAVAEACNMYKDAGDILSALQESHRSFVVYQNCAYAYQSRGRIQPFFYMNDNELRIAEWIAEEASKAWIRSVDEGKKVLEESFTKLFKLDSPSANPRLEMPNEQYRFLNNTGKFREEYKLQYDSIRTYRLCIISSTLMAGVCSLHCNYCESKSYLEQSLKDIKKYEKQDSLYFIFNGPSTAGDKCPEGLCSDNTFDNKKNYVDCIDEMKASCHYHLSFCYLKLREQTKAMEEITKAIDIFIRIYAKDVHNNHQLFVSYILQIFLYANAKKFDEAETKIAYLEGDFMYGLDENTTDDTVFSLRSTALDNKSTPEIYAMELQKLKEVVDRYKSEHSKPTIATHVERMTKTNVPLRRLWHFHMLLVHMAICDKKPEDIMTIALFVLIAIFVWCHSWHSRQYAQYLYDSKNEPYTRLPNDNLRALYPDQHFPQFDERQIPFYEHSGE